MSATKWELLLMPPNFLALGLKECKVQHDQQFLDDALLAAMKKAREMTGLSLDFWADLTDGLDHKCALILVGRSSIFPKNINSNGKE